MLVQSNPKIIGNRLTLKFSVKLETNYTVIGSKGIYNKKLLRCIRNNLSMALSIVHVVHTVSTSNCQEQAIS